MTKLLRGTFIKLMPAFFAASIFFIACISNASLEVNAEASTKGCIIYPIDDIPDVPMPTVIKAEPNLDEDYSSPMSNDIRQENDTGPHFEYLNDIEKAVYKAMLAASDRVFDYDAMPKFTEPYIVKFASGLDSPETPFTNDQYQIITRAVRFDHPELIQLTLAGAFIFYVENGMDNDGNKSYDFYLCLKSMVQGYDQQKFNQMKSELEQARNAFMADPEITGATGAVLKELAIHDKLINENEYDYSDKGDNSSYHLCHTAYGTLINKTSVCDGYAIALSYLLDKVNIDSMTIAGYTKSGKQGNHAWNIVKLDGEWYEVDPTWDDPTISGNYPESYLSEIHHLYYNLTTTEFSNYKKEYKVDGYTVKANTIRQRRDTFEDMPKATGTKYSYENVKELLKESTEEPNVPVTEISFLNNNLSFRVGQEGDIEYSYSPVNATDTDFIWGSSDPSVLAIKDGHYKAIKSGYATITVMTSDKKLYAECKVSITDENGKLPATGIEISESEIMATYGQTGIISYKISPENANETIPVWNCSDTNVVTIEKLGLEGVRYKVVGFGSAEITASTSNGFSATCMIKNPAKSCTISFDLNGGTGTANSLTRKTGEQYGILPNEISREGFEFEGWFTEKENGEQITEETIVLIPNDHVLYAHWKEIEKEPDPSGNEGGDTGNESGNAGNEGGNSENESGTSKNKESNSENEEGNVNNSTGTENGNNNGNSTGNNSTENSNSSISNSSDNTSGSSTTGNRDDSTDNSSGNSSENTNNSTNNNANDDTHSTVNNSNTSNDNIPESATPDADNTNNSEAVNTDTTNATNGSDTASTEESTAVHVENNNQGSVSDLNSETQLPKDRLIFDDNKSIYISSDNNAVIFNIDNKKVKKIFIGDEVAYGNLNFKITEIGSGAFKNCKKLKRVTLGKNVEKIGKNAFKGCKNLGNVKIYANNIKTVKNSFKGIKKGAKFTIICKNKKIFKKVVKMLKKAGADNALYKFKKGNM